MIDRHWYRILDQTTFSTRRTVLELRMGYEYLEARGGNGLAMLLEREYVEVEQPLDAMLEMGFAARTGDDAELARIRPPDPGSSDEEEDEPPRYAPSPGLSRVQRRPRSRAALVRRSAGPPEDGAGPSHRAAPAPSRGAHPLGPPCRGSTAKAACTASPRVPMPARQPSAGLGRRKILNERF